MLKQGFPAYRDKGKHPCSVLEPLQGLVTTCEEGGMQTCYDHPRHTF